jgi:hypothetical protein
MEWGKKLTNIPSKAYPSFNTRGGRKGAIVRKKRVAAFSLSLITCRSRIADNVTDVKTIEYLYQPLSAKVLLGSLN